MKNVVKCSKHFLGYFNTLETHSENIGRNRKTNLKQRSMSSGLADWQYFSLDLSSWQNLVEDLLSALPTSALTAKSAKIAVIAKIAKIGLIFIATRGAQL